MNLLIRHNGTNVWFAPDNDKNTVWKRLALKTIYTE